MKKIILCALALVFILGCGFPQETRRGVGNEGFLRILANPDDAEVYVDGMLAGQAGQFEKNPLELKSGTHKIELRKAGFVPEMHEVYVGNQSRHTLKVNLKKSQ
jgi:hypothetical protein